MLRPKLREYTYGRLQTRTNVVSPAVTRGLSSHVSGLLRPYSAFDPLPPMLAEALTDGKYAPFADVIDAVAAVISARRCRIIGPSSASARMAALSIGAIAYAAVSAGLAVTI